MMCCCLSEGFDLTRFLVTVRRPVGAIFSVPAWKRIPALGRWKAGCGICCNERAEHETEFESPDHGH